MAAWGWYLRRLRVMSATELLHRVREQAQIQKDAWQHRLHPPQPIQHWQLDDFDFVRADHPQLPEQHWHWQQLGVNEADLLDGHHPIMGRPWQWQGTQHNWHRHLDSGISFPKIHFSRINYRQGNPMGDVRPLWETARLQILVAWAAIQQHRKDRRALEHMESLLVGFLHDNPTATGVHYSSAMECALRLLSVCHAADQVRAYQPSDTFWQAVLTLVHGHACLIAKRLSTHSSAGNHTLAECSGLIYAALLFPEFKESSRWLQQACPLMASEADRQILADGGGVEQAFWYTAFITDLCLLSADLLASKKQQPEAQHTLAVAADRARSFLRQWADSPQQLPDIGDRDDAFALSPALDAIWHTPVSQRPALHNWPDSGYSRIQCGSAGLELTYCMDHGPFGMPPSYGHGHADALSITATVNGQAWLMDAGTGTYNGDPELRRYGRSIRAHNCLQLADHDPGIQAGNFLWQRVSAAHGSPPQTDEQGIIRLLAWHDGYADLGHRHWRGVSWHPNGEMLVCDILDGTSRLPFCLRWHFSHALQTTPDKNLFRGNAPMAFTVQQSGAGDSMLQAGHNSPPVALHAPRYDLWLPMHGLYRSGNSQPGMPWITHFTLSQPATLQPDHEVSCFQLLIDAAACSASR